MGEGGQGHQMNRSVVKKLDWIDGRGVVLVLRAIQEKESRRSQTKAWLKSVLLFQKFNKQEPVSNEHTQDDRRDPGTDICVGSGSGPIGEAGGADYRGEEAWTAPTPAV